MTQEEQVTDTHRKEEFIRLLGGIAATVDSDVAQIMGFIMTDITEKPLSKAMLEDGVKRALKADNGQQLKQRPEYYEELICGAFDMLLRGVRNTTDDNVDDLLPPPRGRN
ncbi:MAG: hypothetical protein ACN2B6_06555 [Rickettsiales bacterium]